MPVHQYKAVKLVHHHELHGSPAAAMKAAEEQIVKSAVAGAMGEIKFSGTYVVIVHSCSNDCVRDEVAAELEVSTEVAEIDANDPKKAEALQAIRLFMKEGAS